MRLAAVFSDHMVFQKDKKICIFGESEKAYHLKISIDDLSAGEDIEEGVFRVFLPEHPAGGPYTLTVDVYPAGVCEPGEEVDPVRRISISDVYFGEVWIANGQSNIEFEIQNSDGGEEELLNADYPDIRYFKSIKSPVVDDALTEAEKSLRWHTLQNGDFREMSGVGYFFAKKLHEETGEVVGMIDCYQGGTSISCWLNEDVLLSCPEGRMYQDEFLESVKGQTEEDYERLLLQYNEMVDRHLRLSAQAKADDPDISPEELKAIAGDYPWPPPPGLKSAFRPCGLYHSMLERIAPFQTRGLIYYQGEEDAGKYDRYEILLNKLVDEYRELFMDEALPVAIIQLPMFIGRGEEDSRNWAYMRRIQENVEKAKDGVFMVSLIDCGEYDNVHPTDKKTPGERTALRALYSVYGSSKGSREPGLKGISEQQLTDGFRYTISFNDADEGLNIRDNVLMDLRCENPDNDSEHIYGFEVLPENEYWKVPEKVYISDSDIVIENSHRVKEIRYAFFNYGKVNLYGGNSMPVRQFDGKVL